MRIQWLSGSLAAMLIILLITAFSGQASANPVGSTSRLEGVLVVDVSRSMLTSDPNKISDEAMKMFIDMASLKGDKIGVIAYAGGLANKQDLIKLQTEQDKVNLKNFIDSLGNFPNTDMSIGLTEAVKTLDNGHEQGYSPLIVLLADGNNDLAPNSVKTEQQAADEQQAAVEAAKEKGYPIYVIGLNADGTLNKDGLQKVATDTKGKFFETNNANDLPGILSEIFAEHLKLKIMPVEDITAQTEFQDIPFEIPNDSVLEANISLVSSRPVEVKLVDPSGTEQTIPSEKITVTKSRTYSMIKMIKPTEGQWTLKVKGVPNDKIDINFVFNYDLQLMMAPLQATSYNAGDTIEVNAFFEENEIKITDAELYKTMTAKLLVKDLKKGTVKEIPLNPGDQGFTGDFSAGESSNYEVIVRAESESFFRETAPQQFTVEQPAPAPVVEEEPAAAETKSFPWLYAGGAALILLILFLPIYTLTSKKRKEKKNNIGMEEVAAASTGFALFGSKSKKNRGYNGEVVIEIKDDETGEIIQSLTKKLKTIKEEFTLKQLFTLGQEFDELENIGFVPLTDFALLMFDKSKCDIEVNGEKIDPADPYCRFKRNDRLRIIFQSAKKTLYVQFK